MNHQISCPFSKKELEWVDDCLNTLANQYSEQTPCLKGGPYAMPLKFYFCLLITVCVDIFNRQEKQEEIAAFHHEALHLEQLFQARRKAEDWPSLESLCKLFPILTGLADELIEKNFDAILRMNASPMQPQALEETN